MSTQLVTWRRHKCNRTHSGPNTWIKCAIGAHRVLWVKGSGPYATISWCGEWDEVTVVLHEYLANAQMSLREINRTSCGARCLKRHQTVKVSQ